MYKLIDRVASTSMFKYARKTIKRPANGINPPHSLHDDVDDYSRSISQKRDLWIAPQA